MDDLTDFMHAAMPFTVGLGIEVQSAAKNEVRLRVAWTPERCTAGGVLHGGSRDPDPGGPATLSRTENAASEFGNAKAVWIGARRSARPARARLIAGLGASRMATETGRG